MSYVKAVPVEKVCGLKGCGIRFLGEGRDKYCCATCAKAAQDAQLINLNERRLVERRKGKRICPTCGQPIKSTKGASDEGVLLDRPR